jgi:hypothetical protein
MPVLCGSKKVLWYTKMIKLSASEYSHNHISHVLQSLVELTVNEIWLTGGGSKSVTLDTGAVVNVPLFVSVGEEILVDTRSGQYMSRA